MKQKQFLMVATGGAGGDLQPLIAAALAVRDRGHHITFIGDRSVGRALSQLGVGVQVLPSELDLGPRLAGAIRSAMVATDGNIAAAGPIVEQKRAEWAGVAAQPISRAIAELRPDAVVTSLFGVEVVQRAEPPCPWAVINSTFYLGPNPPRPIEQDVGVRAIPLLSRYAQLVSAAGIVLHATDQVFDFCFDRLPPGHHYVGPLGIWEPPMDSPSYLNEPGESWVLVSISSQIQDDVALAQAALHALANRPVRVVVTLGPDHKPEEITDVPPNAQVEQLVSHSAVLDRGRLLIAHAGHGSVMKALWYGRPMVLMPWGRDQPGVAARARALGVAEVLERGQKPKPNRRMLSIACWRTRPCRTPPPCMLSACAKPTRRALPHTCWSRWSRDELIASLLFNLDREVAAWIPAAAVSHCGLTPGQCRNKDPGLRMIGRQPPDRRYSGA
jgi:UDP:flavonoid glycosyltransferase YjiC (YdhE family)